MMRALWTLPLLFVAACSSNGGADEQANATDPAVADAMAGPIMTDMQMGGTSAPDALRPGNQPPALPVPVDARVDTKGALPLGEVVRARLGEAGFAGCSAEVKYTAMWSLKLPKPFELTGDARLSEAAGTDAKGCALRIVRFALPGAPDKALGDFATRAKGAGFTATRTGDVLSGTRSGDGAGLWVSAVASNDGARVDLITRAR